VGHLTADPELRPLPSGDNVCNMRIACNGRRRTVDGGYETRPNYFNISVFGNQCENVYRYLRKGRAVAVDGRLEWREWETADQQKRQAVTIVATDVQFLRGAAPNEEPRSTDDQEIEDMELLTATESIEEELNSVEVELGNPVDSDEEQPESSESSEQEESSEEESSQEKSSEAPEPDLVGAAAGGEDGELLF
jgi:single stranded DNA-binding protein